MQNEKLTDNDKNNANYAAPAAGQYVGWQPEFRNPSPGFTLYFVLYLSKAEGLSILMLSPFIHQVIDPATRSG